jgi:malto-oligosyltrehalose trehalohydrolase
VLPYAPHPAYGAPDDLRALVDAAHAHGLMVLLDVVYNHFGPEGNYLHLYAEPFFDPSRQTPWGAAIDYAKPPVRRFFADNALHWLHEYRLDGLRLDAIDQIRDPSEPDILVEIARRVRAEIPDRPVHLTTEDNRNLTYLHERGPGGSVPLYTAEWNDDFHNAAHVLATGETAGYYADFAEAPLSQFARSLAEGFAWQGEPSAFTGGPRGRPSAHMPPAAFVDFLQNHDQIGNRAFGERLAALTEPDLLRALRFIHLLSPHIPLLFMGEEWGETRPFLFFTDFHGDLADAVRVGRRREFADFPAFAGHAEDLARIPDPNDPDTFAASRPARALAEAPEGRAVLEETRRLLAARAEHLVPRLAGAASGRVLAAEAGALAVDWPLSGAAWRLRANLGEAPKALPAAAGREIAATHASDVGPAPARYAAWFLDPGGEA